MNGSQSPVSLVHRTWHSLMTSTGICTHMPMYTQTYTVGDHCLPCLNSAESMHDYMCTVDISWECLWWQSQISMCADTGHNCFLSSCRKMSFVLPTLCSWIHSWRTPFLWKKPRKLETQCSLFYRTGNLLVPQLSLIWNWLVWDLLLLGPSLCILLPSHTGHSRVVADYGARREDLQRAGKMKWRKETIDSEQVAWAPASQDE